MIDTDEWLTLKEAAEQIGCSVITLRRMIKRNTVQAKQVDTPNGRAWRVLSSTLISLPRVHVAQGDHALGVQGDQGPVALELVRLVAQLQADKAELAQRVGFLQAELQKRDEQLKALQAPQSEPTSVEPASALETTEEPPRGPWRRLWRWMMATG